MLLGFLSDAHGNPFGFHPCYTRLREEGAERIYFLGDAVGYWPHSLEVLRELLKRRIPCIKGNHEAMLVGLLPILEEDERIYRLRPLVSATSSRMRQLIADEWPIRREIVAEGRRILLVHGRPNNCLEGYLYEDETPSSGESADFDTVVMGHTHRAFVRKEQGVLWLNAGSCGLPRDIGNMASCALYDTVSNSARILREAMNTKGLLASCGKGSVASEVMRILSRGREDARFTRQSRNKMSSRRRSGY